MFIENTICCVYMLIKTTILNTWKNVQSFLKKLLTRIYAPCNIVGVRKRRGKNANQSGNLENRR